MTFRIRTFGDQEWFWEIVFANGKVAATSDDFYRTERSATQSARRVLKAMSDGYVLVESPSVSAVVMAL